MNDIGLVAVLWAKSDVVWSRMGAALKRLASAATALVALGLLLSSSAFAAQRYAEPGGNGPVTTCPQADPCDIQAAVEDVSVDAGDEIILLPGTYIAGATGADTLALSEAITVHGLPGAAIPVLQSAAPYAVSVGDPGALVQRLEVRYSGAANGGNGLYLTAGAAQGVIVHSTITGGAACRAQGTVALRDTICAATGPNALALDSYSAAATPWAITLRNVTAVSSQFYSVAVGVNGATVTVSGKGLIANGATTDILATAMNGGNVTVTLSHSNFKLVGQSTESGGTATTTFAGTGTNQSELPIFVDAAAGDFHQAPGSPTINAGTIDGSSGPTDIDGEARRLGFAADIGADEFTEAPDADADGVGDPSDNCPTMSNIHQTNTDSDAQGDVCDLDDDNDGVADASDDCATTAGTSANGGCPGGRPDTTAPQTTLRKVTIKQAKRTAAFRFVSSERGSRFRCKLDRKPYRSCVSSKTYRRLKPGKHVVRIVAVDAAGNTDRTPAVKRFRIRRQS